VIVAFTAAPWIKIALSITWQEPKPKRNPFKGHRFPPEVILLAVRWYCRYPLSCRDVRDLLAERGIHVDPGTINRWVLKFGPEIAKRSFTHGAISGAPLTIAASLSAFG
jgi:hypothetical protein